MYITYHLFHTNLLDCKPWTIVVVHAYAAAFGQDFTQYTYVQWLYVLYTKDDVGVFSSFFRALILSRSIVDKETQFSRKNESHYELATTPSFMSWLKEGKYLTYLIIHYYIFKFREGFSPKQPPHPL